MNRNLLGMLLLFLCPLSLMSCSDDESKDHVSTTRMYVSSETGTYRPWGVDYAVECMLVKESGEAAYKSLSFSDISGFTYERGYQYQLLVEKTILANPPADGSNVRYRLIEVEQKQEQVKSESTELTEEQITYKENCPYTLYKIDDNKITIDSDGLMQGAESQKSYRLGSFYLERAIGPENEYYYDATYSATHAYVADPYPLEAPSPYLRDISRGHSGFAFRNVLTEEAYAYMQQAPTGTALTYQLILINPEGLALQKIEVSFIKK